MLSFDPLTYDLNGTFYFWLHSKQLSFVFSSFPSFFWILMPCRGSSALHRVNPNLKNGDKKRDNIEYLRLKKAIQDCDSQIVFYIFKIKDNTSLTFSGTINNPMFQIIIIKFLKLTKL